MIFDYQLIKTKQKLTMKEPTVRECDGILSPVTTDKLIEAATDFLSKNLENITVRDKISGNDILALRIRLSTWLRQLKENPAYKTPPVQSTAQTEIPYQCTTTHIKAVADYTGMSFSQVWELPITEYWILYRDAVIWYYSRTEEGIDKLNHAKVISAKEPDREKLSSCPAIIRRRNNGE